MLHNYLLTNPHVFITEEQRDANGNVTRKAEPYVQGLLVDLTKRKARKRVLTVFKAMDEELITAIRKLLPSTGQWVDVDGNEHPWNGLRELAPTETFGEAEYQAVVESLKPLLSYEDGKYIDAPLGGKYAMKYSQNLGSHKKDDWVCEPNSNFIRVFETVRIFVMVNEENPDPNIPDDYVDGWEPNTVVQARKALYIPIESITPDQLKGCRFKTDVQGAAIVTVEDNEDPGI